MLNAPPCQRPNSHCIREACPLSQQPSSQQLSPQEPLIPIQYKPTASSTADTCTPPHPSAQHQNLWPCCLGPFPPIFQPPFTAPGHAPLHVAEATQLTPSSSALSISLNIPPHPHTPSPTRHPFSLSPCRERASWELRRTPREPHPLHPKKNPVRPRTYTFQHAPRARGALWVSRLEGRLRTHGALDAHT